MSTHRSGASSRNEARQFVTVISGIALGSILVLALIVGFGSAPSSAQADPTPEDPPLLFQTAVPSEDEDDGGEGETPGFQSGGQTNNGDEDEPAEAAAGSDTLEFGADAWSGGYYRGDAEWYGRPWISLYGAQSEYPRGTIQFELARDPSRPIVLTIEGLDDEAAGRNQIAVFVNGQRVFTGDAWFEGWDGTGQGETAPWTAVEITIPAGLFVAGQNRISITNESPAANFGGPPYVLLSTGSLEAGEDDLFGPAADDEISIDVEIVS